jgi:hypothetical protein
MGYCMHQTEASFFIPKEYHGIALAAIKDFMLKQHTADSGMQVIRSYSFVNTEEVVQSQKLQDALYAWRWEADSDDGNEDIDGIYFRGEKSGEDEYLFRVLAPYVKEGSYISMRGEDDALWRWYFDGQKCIEQYGRVIWE